MKAKYLIILFPLIISCNSPKSTLFEFDPRALVENKINLADISDDINRFVDSSIYLATKDYGIMEFNRHGKFIKRIGALGRGPGEYHYFWIFDVDPKTKSVYLLDFNMIKVYSVSGQFQRSFSLKEQDQDYYSDLSFINNKLLISCFIVRGQSKYSWLVLDTTGQILKKKYNPIPAFNTNMESEGGTYVFDNKIFWWELYNDMVYSILPDFSYKASFLFSPGDYKWPKVKVQGSIPEMQSIISKYYRTDLIFETNRFLVIQNKGFYVLVDKKSKKPFVNTSLNANNRSGIFNDLDGGTLFQPQYYFVENDREYMIGLLNPSELKSYISTNDFKNIVPKYSEKKKTLEKLAHSLKEIDNQIFVIVRLNK